MTVTVRPAHEIHQPLSALWIFEQGQPVVGSVRPGLHKSMAGGVSVVWWDPAALAIDVEEQAPLRQQRILEIDPDGAAAAASEENYVAWKTERAALLDQASKPLLSVQTVTSLARSDALKAAETGGDELDARAHARVDVEKVERGDFERSGGRRFGALVHAILAAIDLDASDEAIQASAAINGRILGATNEEIDAAITTVGGALVHPILRRAAASAKQGGLRRETPVLLNLDDGSLVEGVVDLAFREDSADFAGWIVVDFKTDREFEASSDRYIAQVRIYSEAVRAQNSVYAEFINHAAIGTWNRLRQWSRHIGTIATHVQMMIARIAVPNGTF